MTKNEEHIFKVNFLYPVCRLIGFSKKMKIYLPVANLWKLKIENSNRKSKLKKCHLYFLKHPTSKTESILRKNGPFYWVKKFHFFLEIQSDSQTKLT